MEGFKLTAVVPHSLTNGFRIENNTNENFRQL